MTVKGVNFLGPYSEYVVSGSDDGHIYVWEKESQKIVQWLSGDEAGVVNALEPHPTLPYMATSGLDHSVKIWAPKRRNHNNLLGLASVSMAGLTCDVMKGVYSVDVLQVMAENNKMRDNGPMIDGLFDARMLMMLMQTLSSSEVSRHLM